MGNSNQKDIGECKNIKVYYQIDNTYAGKIISQLDKLGAQLDRLQGKSNTSNAVPSQPVFSEVRQEN